MNKDGQTSEQQIEGDSDEQDSERIDLVSPEKAMSMNDVRMNEPDINTKVRRDEAKILEQLLAQNPNIEFDR